MDQYMLGMRLGGGRHGEVFIAWDLVSDRAVALKKIPLTHDNMIGLDTIREANLLYEMDHDNIVRLSGVFPHEGFIYLVLEYVRLNLHTYMKLKHEDYPVIIKNFLKQILTAVSYCHAHGVMHRDLKPENILVDHVSNTVKLADFGMSRGFLSSAMRPSPEVVTLTYRAPELLLGSRYYSFPVDIWSVGCVFAEMVNKEPLFYGDYEIDVLHDICRKMGTPTEELWPGVTLLPHFPPEFLHSHSQYDPLDLALLVPGLEVGGLDLLSKLLCMDPNGRITAKDALEHAYLME